MPGTKVEILGHSLFSLFIIQPSQICPFPTYSEQNSYQKVAWLMLPKWSQLQSLTDSCILMVLALNFIDKTHYKLIVQET